MKNILILLLFLPFGKSLAGQSLSLKDKVDAAELIFEGRVIADSGFQAPNTTFIYTAEYVLISKEFKGHFSSDTIVIIIQGGRANGIFSKRQDERTYLWNGAEGLFFCTRVNPKSFPGIANTSYWATIKHMGDGVINIFCDKKLPPDTHRASCYGVFFDDLEKELYTPIQEMVGEKYKQVRLNCLEQNKPLK